MTEDCSLNPAGHRYFVAGKSYVDYVPVPQTSHPIVYERKEYVILSCNCGSTIRKQVLDK